MKFIYQGIEYPNVRIREEDYEQVEVIIPFLKDEYFLALISSAGEYHLLEDNINIKDLQIII